MFIFLMHVQLMAVDPYRFLEKLQEPTPKWMEEQIESNLQPFKKELSCQNLDRFFNEYAHSMGLIRVRIFRGQLFFDGTAKDLANSYAQKFLIPLKRMHEIYPLPDLDFIFTHFDIPYYYHTFDYKNPLPEFKYALFCRAKNQFK